MNSPFTPPSFQETAFNCPFCNAYAKQSWFSVFAGGSVVAGLNVAYCSRCKDYSVWVGTRMVEPLVTSAPTPNPDTPEEILLDYDEARDILQRSPRGAAALLRLCIQKLMPHLGEDGKDINHDIGELVKKGLPTKIQQALDSVRVVGNEAVHPGELDIRDDVATATALFHLFNLIVDNQISEAKRVADIYEMIPEPKAKGIAQRDKSKDSPVEN